MAAVPESPKARLVRGTAWSFTATALTKIAFVVNSIVVARLLGVTQFGIFALLTSSLGLVGLVAGLGISGAMVKYVAQYDTKSRSRLAPLISTAMSLVCVTAGISAIALIFIAGPLALGVYNEPRLVEMLMVASIPLFVNAFSAPLFSVLQGFQKIREMSLRNIVVTFISVPITIGLVYVWGLWGTVFAIITGAFIGLAVNLGIILKLLREKNVKLRVGFDRSEVKTIFSYAMPLLLVGLVVSPVSWVVLTMLQHFHGADAVGYYSVANSLASSLLLIPTAISTPMIPLVSELDIRDRERMQSMSSKVLRMTFLFFLPMALALAMFSRLALEILYGSGYVGAWQVLYMLCAGTFLIAADNVIVIVLLGTGRMWVSFGLNVTWMISLLATASLLVPSYAEIGLGTAYLVSQTVYTAVILAYAHRKLGIVLHDMEVVLLIAAFGFGLAVIPSFLVQGWLSYLAGLGVLAAIAVGEAVVLQKHEWDFLRGILRRVSR